MEKIKNFNEFINKETLNENTFEIDDNMLYEMASVGYFTTFKKNGKQESPKFKVFVCGDEGEIPHMHIWDDETNGKKMHTCVCLNKIEYFHHTGKEGVLNSKQRKSLVDFLNKPFDEDTSNWEYLIMTWNANNSNKKLSKKMPMPDYTNIK